MPKQHFTATGIVFNARGQVLMILHRKLGVWLPPGGHVEPDETPDDAVKREVFEETGVRVELLDGGLSLGLDEPGCRELRRPFVVLLEDIEGNGEHNHIDLVYLCSASDDATAPHPGEVDGIGWFEAGEIRKLDTYENVIRTVEKAAMILGIETEIVSI